MTDRYGQMPYVSIKAMWRIKNHHVGMMGSIYQSAIQVSWLGQADDTIGDAIPSLTPMLHGLQNHPEGIGFYRSTINPYSVAEARKRASRRDERGPPHTMAPWVEGS